MRENCKISPKAIIMDNVIIGDNVVIEDNVYVDYGVIIRDNVHIKSGTTIGARSILGEYLYDFYLNNHVNSIHPLVIGKNSIIRSETIIYGDTTIGDNFQTGHRVTIIIFYFCYFTNIFCRTTYNNSHFTNIFSYS